MHPYIDQRPGRTARLQREVDALAALKTPAPIGWDASKAEDLRASIPVGVRGPLAQAEAAISAKQAVVERETQIHVPQAPLQRADELQTDWTRVQIGPDGWTGWIDAPAGGWGKCPIPLARAGEWELRFADGDAAIRRRIFAGNIGR